MTETNEKKLKKKMKTKTKALMMLGLFMIVLTGAAVFATNSEYFSIRSIKVERNLFVSKEEITLLANMKGQNIFLIDKNKIEKRIRMNPYIEKIFVKRQLPDAVTIEVVEKKIRGVVKFQNGFINIDSEGRMVQMVSKFPNGKLPIIAGINIKSYSPNQYLYNVSDNRLAALKATLTISDYKESRYFFKSINVTDAFNITLQSNEGYIVKIGDWTNIDYKIAYAITIIKSSSIKGLNGYIQLQDDGSAIFKKNGKREK